ncbi:hypothetical protein KBY97_06240 [Synechococcus sp. ATX 2A4]|uniref:hypothetical protein n=1 Tax=Synechococcus sp. ATX 2A4 TaxID=2823727 RepID=UPI0020CFCC70|nr:hypothetical protein [Synechococcus sp. ATX 2A4]MCP9884724.1 hypothetical protein [Synechococcus sp. ATX 2A4]
MSTTRLQRLLLPPVAATLAVIVHLAAGQALAVPGAGPGAGGGAGPGAGRKAWLESVEKLTPSQKQELFSFRRSQSLKTHAEQISILQNGERCITAATDMEALQACRQKAMESRRALMSKNRDQARAINQKLGLPMPEPKGDGKGGRRGWGGKQAL